MSATRPKRILVAVVVLVLLGVLGLRDVANEWIDGLTTAQRVAKLAELTYSVAGLSSAVGLMTGARWARPVLLVWAICVVLTSGLAPVVWGGAGVLSGVASALAGAAIAGAVAHLARPVPAP